MLITKLFAKYLEVKEKGQGLVEYAIIVVAVVLIAIAVRGLFGDSVNNLFTNLSNQIQAAVAP
jgi:pilus assembly protein Flp/PilA